MSTDLNVDIREFDEFNYQSEQPSIELIFCIKELNAFLGSLINNWINWYSNYRIVYINVIEI